MERGQSKAPTVAIVGRPNVGKSALFNRLVGSRVALVEDLPGTTRDRLVAELDWHGRPLRIIDTGGLETSPTGRYAALIRWHIEAALAEADAILFVLDGRDGLTAEDYDVAELLRRARQPVMLVANKVDNERRELDAVQFYELGLGDPVPVSAYHGYGISDMLDALLEQVPEVAGGAETQPLGPALAIIGRPNAGKSLLVNALLGEERVIVSEVPGTTRDAIDTQLEFEGQELTLIDTAGIRRRGHIVPGVERHSVYRAQEAVDRCDVALVIVDATDPVTAQDLHVIQLADEGHKGLVLVLNKIDLLTEPGAQQELRRYVRQRLRFVPWAPIVFISAKERIGLSQLLQSALHAAEQRDLRVATAPLNSLLKRAAVEHPPRSVLGRRLKLLYATQASVRPPTFALFVNDASLLHFAYQRYLENRLRVTYGFEGTAIRLVFKSRDEAQTNFESAEERIAARERRRTRGADAMVNEPSSTRRQNERGQRE
ncbi:MAG: ribosome biogenesis GTPase Der [Dehalococcoidia bacterium]